MVPVVAKTLRAGAIALFQRSTAITSTSRTLRLPPRCQEPWPRQQRHSSSSDLKKSADFHLDLGGGNNPLLKDHEKQESSNNLDTLDEPQPTAVPWYLQVNAPSRPQQFLSERKEIPDLPESSPIILEPLLQRIYVDLGLDNLTLLDLRHIDPPPALGANLLMIIGTARSEKHLHVSADRLCRWLRSQYKLNPDADGLLGRNELKLKLKRRNRKAKLAGSGMMEEGIDDGIRTGWICVSVDAIDDSARTKRVEAKKESFIGFRRKISRANIVIQMLTQEKREELGLEELWGGIARQRSPPRSNADTATQDAEIKPLVHSPQSNLPVIELKSTNPSHSRTLVLSSSISSQSRAFHTSATRPSPPPSQIAQTEEFDGTCPALLGQTTSTGSTKIGQKVLDAMALGDYSTVKGLVSENDHPEFQGNGWRVFFLNCLRVHLQSLPLDQAITSLGHGFNDSSSTPFLSCVYQIMPNFLSAAEWEFYVWMCCFARNIGHRGYTLNSLSILFTRLRLSGTPISNSMYLTFLRSLLHPNFEKEVRARPKWYLLAERILRDMEHRTGSVLTEDVFVAINESIQDGTESKPLLQLPTDNSSFDIPIRPSSNIRLRLNALMWELDVPITCDESRIRLLNAFAKKDQWVTFWKLWGHIALKGMPRSAALYTCMFRRVAETNFQKACIRALRTWIPTMENEVPKVELGGEVREAVLACLRIADPLTTEEMIQDPKAVGEWLDLWRRCLPTLPSSQMYDQTRKRKTVL